nr:PREDICTED: putative SWI/SNF-related matrix-associated actin-dependent regulator of chromatin subfamily A member 3-like 1 [Daucus carota subsp. sativus]
MLYRSTYIVKVITSPARSFPKEVSIQLLWWRSIQKVDGMIEIVVFRYFIIGIVLGTSVKLGFIWSSGVTVQVCKSCTVTLVVSSAGNASNLIDLVASRTTLVVSSTSVFSTCKEQLKKHTKPGKLSVYLYYEQRTKNPMELVKYDLVLTTYSLLASELESGSPVFQVPWWRVILDEAHLINHSTPTQASAVLRLNARRRRLVTGTPIQNTTIVLYSLMSFLKYNPFTDKHSRKKTLLKPVDTSCNGSYLFEDRTKEQNILGLPRKIMKICSVDLSAEERQLYDQMEVEAKTAVQDYISSGTVRSLYIAVLGIVLRLRQTCTHMDLCPKDHIATLPCSNKEAVDGQAMDRVLRIGQMKEVTIVRIIAGKSIEERILEVRDGKKRMASKALDRKPGH